MSSPVAAVLYKVSNHNVKNPYHCGGLAVNALHTVGVLERMGVRAHLQQVVDYAELRAYVALHRELTHVVVEAVWISAADAKALALDFPHVTFVVRAHSKIGFLQVEPEAITVARRILDSGLRNLHFASNNQEFASSLTQVYGRDCLYLPNMYDVQGSPRHAPGHPTVLKIASFGATRLLKLHPNAALAALQIARAMGRELVFYVNVDKTPGGDSVRRSVRNLFEGLTWARLVEIGWQDAEVFRKTISEMDLVIQASATETFCMVAADAVASGVPVVTGPAITWVPPRSQAPIDDTTALARAGVDALTSRRVVKGQMTALTDFIRGAEAVWSEFLRLPRARGWRLWD